MKDRPHVLAIVLAGGEGNRLFPLTKERAKPAVPFGGQYRLIDFALSNLVNGGFRHIVALTQYKSHSLDRHLARTWSLSGLIDEYVASVPAQMRMGPRWFAGSADAIYQNLNIVRPPRSARVHHSPRSRPHLPNGPPAAPGRPHRVGRRGERRRPTGPDQRCRGVWCHRYRCKWTNSCVSGEAV